jgi:2',3'-cyclic-nucleotide 2'-phosphodiesterase (5'-nucleotidase family)
LRDEGSSGGLGRIVSAIKHLKDALPSLIVDAGNILGPDILSSRDGGRSVTEAMRSVGYAAVGLGYHTSTTESIR